MKARKVGFQVTLKNRRASKAHLLSGISHGDLHRFFSLLPLVALILRRKPESLYGLSKALGTDVGNLGKSVRFLRGLGIVVVRYKVEGGRKKAEVSCPFEQVIIDLHPQKPPKSSRRRLISVARRR